MSHVLIIGAKSDIAKAIARRYAREGFNLTLAARHAADLEEFATDLSIRHECQVECMDLDILDIRSHAAFYASLSEPPDGVVCAVGYLGDQETAQEDFEEARRIIDTNYTAIASLINIIANDFHHRRSGFIIGISSVAGDRGRKSNYIYGSAKAALSCYLSGLRNRLYESNVQVLTVKPGFVETRMTKRMDLPKALTASPEQVADDVYNAQIKGSNVLYTKWIWRWIMLVIKHIPEFQFKKMSI